MAAKRIGIIGAGNMGSRIARCLLEAGEPIVAFDRDESRLAESGIPPAASAEELVTGVDVVLLSLPDSSVIEPVVLGDDGVEAHCRSGQIVIDLSTASPASTVAIHERLRAKGVEYLDAGISGGAKAADSGTLTLMVGGSEEALERCGRSSTASARRSSTWALPAPATWPSCSTTSSTASASRRRPR